MYYDVLYKDDDSCGKEQQREINSDRSRPASTVNRVKPVAVVLLLQGHEAETADAAVPASSSPLGHEGHLALAALEAVPAGPQEGREEAAEAAAHADARGGALGRLGSKTKTT